MEQKKEITGYKLSTEEDVCYAHQVLGRAGAESALMVLYICKKVGLFLKTISCGSQFLKGSPRERTKVALGAVVHVAVLTVSIKLAPA